MLTSIFGRSITSVTGGRMTSTTALVSSATSVPPLSSVRVAKDTFDWRYNFLHTHVEQVRKLRQRQCGRADNGREQLHHLRITPELGARLARDPFQHFDIEASGAGRRPAFQWRYQAKAQWCAKAPESPT